MIEIEKKYLIDDEKVQEIVKDADFLGQKELTDIYYDTADFRLTTKDWWLRNRNGVFELKKVVVGETKDINVDRYDEIDDEKEIAKDLEISFKNNLAESLKKNQIEPFATIVAMRKKYTKGSFNLDLDLTDFGYSICEIELMVEDETKMADAMAKIENFRVEYGLNAGHVRGKLVEYIYRNRPEHYAILLRAGVIR